MKGSEIFITNNIILKDLNMAVKTKLYSPGPGGYERSGAQAQINGASWGELNVGCSESDGAVFIGRPEEFLSPRPEFAYAKLEVSSECAQALYRNIARANER